MWEKIIEAVSSVFTAIGTLLSKVVDLVLDGVSYVTSGLFWLLTSPAMLFGVKPEQLWHAVRSVARPAFETISGILEGAVRVPFSAAGVGLTFVKNFFSFAWVTSGSRAIELLLQPITGAGLTAVSPLFFGIKGLSDAVHPPRPLTDEERRQLSADYPPEVLERVRVVEGRSIIQTLFMVQMASAFTIGNTVYVSSNSSAKVDFLRHELVHTLQYADAPGGVPGFLGSYYARFVGNLLTNGFDVYQAYADVPQEAEAYAATR